MTVEQVHCKSICRYQQVPLHSARSSIPRTKQVVSTHMSFHYVSSDLIGFSASSFRKRNKLNKDRIQISTLAQCHPANNDTTTTTTRTNAFLFAPLRCRHPPASTNVTDANANGNKMKIPLYPLTKGRHKRKCCNFSVRKPVERLRKCRIMYTMNRAENQSKEV